LEMVHHRFAQGRSRHFAPVASVHFGLHAADNCINLLVAHRPLVTGALQTATQLVPVEFLTRLVLLDDLERRFLNQLDGEHTALACGANAPSPHGKPIGRRARVDDLKVAFVAKRAFHGAFRLARGSPERGYSSPIRESGKHEIRNLKSEIQKQITSDFGSRISDLRFRTWDFGAVPGPACATDRLAWPIAPLVPGV